MRCDIEGAEARSAAYFDRYVFDVVKGIALILMFIHHFFTFPSWYVPEISYPALESFAVHFSAPTRICVSVFAFLSGYFYCFNGDKTFRYSLRKISDLLIAYWAVYALLLLAAYAAAGYVPDRRAVVFELFAIKRPVMCFCWYVVFYYTFMSVLPLLYRLLDRGIPAAILFGVVLPVVVSRMIALQFSSDVVQEIVAEFAPWFQVTAVGYLFARYDLFRRIFDAAWKDPLGKTARVAVWLLLACAAFFARFYCTWFSFGPIAYKTGEMSVTFNPDMLYAPVFLYAVGNLCALLPREKLGAAVMRVGRYSLLMWFFHCVFFGPSRDVAQRLLFFPKFPPLVLLWGLALCYAAARLVDPLIRLLTARKNRIFF